MVGNYTSILSQLIYDCQMVVLAQVLAETADQPEADIGAMIMDIRDQWLLNDTNGPVAELLENQLLGFHISKTKVLPAQLRWHADGKTLVWSEEIFSQAYCGAESEGMIVLDDYLERGSGRSEGIYAASHVT
ncbi:hypothetical protein GB937_010792 [Aspergillus fischeri]|nr:hypothetical protein GB937_010792 [Aspergillus fischeri]